MSACYETLSPIGEKLALAFDVDENDIYSKLTTPELLKEYYEQNGYVVVRGCLPDDTCNQLVKGFYSEVKTYPGLLYRQTTSLMEKHQLTESGHMINSLKHLQDYNQQKFPSFVASFLNLLTSPELVKQATNLCQDKPIVVQTMLFEGNPSTPAHSDSYYLDSEKLGSMSAAWIALEDIHPGAGRFYVYPKSHRLNDLPKNAPPYDMSFNHKNYLNKIQELIRTSGLECHAPTLKKGDILFWNSMTIHGSLKTTAPEHSRLSITAHFIPSSAGYVLHQKIPQNLVLKEINGLLMHCPTDQSRLSNKIKFALLTYFPGAVDFARKLIRRVGK